MIPKSFTNKLGSLSLAILENFIAAKLGDGFIKELRGNYKKKKAVTEALINAQERFIYDCNDKDLSTAMFIDLSQKDRPILLDAVGRFYERPTDPSFPKALEAILLGDFSDLAPVRVEKAVNLYVELLTEELALADSDFQKNVRALAELRQEKILNKILKRIDEPNAPQREITSNINQEKDAPQDIEKQKNQSPLTKFPVTESTPSETDTDPTSPMGVFLLNTLSGHTNWVWGVAFSPDGKRIASGSTDSTIKIWDVASAQLVRELITRRNISGFDNVFSVQFSHDGRVLASGHMDGSVHLWQVASGREIVNLRVKSGQDPIESLAFSSDDKYLFSSSSLRGIMRVWKLDSFEQVDEIIYFRRTEFNTKIKRAISLAGKSDIKIFNLTTKKQIRRIKGGLVSISSLALSPDCHYLAGGNEDFGIQIWDATNGKEMFWLEGHTGTVTSLAYNPVGSILASGSADKTVHLWETSTGKEIAKLEAQAQVNRLRFSADGSILAAGNGGPTYSNDYSGTVQLWKIQY